MEVQPPKDLFGGVLAEVPVAAQPRPRAARGAGYLLLGGVALLALLNVRWMAGGPHATAPLPSSGMALPDAALPLYDGGKLSLAAQKGHPLVLVFFATWCGPCLQELPDVTRAYQQLAQKHVPLYAVSVDGPSLDEAREAVAEFRAHHPNPLPVAFDLNTLSAPFRVATIPRTLVFDGTGHLADTLDGPQDTDSILRAVDSTH